jgi:hypothetical protein
MRKGFVIAGGVGKAAAIPAAGQRFNSPPGLRFLRLRRSHEGKFEGGSAQPASPRLLTDKENTASYYNACDICLSDDASLPEEA